MVIIMERLYVVPLADWDLGGVRSPELH